MGLMEGFVKVGNKVIIRTHLFAPGKRAEPSDSAQPACYYSRHGR